MSTIFVVRFVMAFSPTVLAFKVSVDSIDNRELKTVFPTITDFIPLSTVSENNRASAELRAVSSV